MSNIVPLIIGGGVLAFFMTQKKKPVSSSPLANDSKIGSKEKGYEIINCNKVIIYDKEKAYQYAYTLGATIGMKILDMKGKYAYSSDALLTGDCLEKNIEGMNKEQAFPIVKKLFKDKKTVKFIFDLYRHFHSGLVGIVDVEEELSLERLNKMKSTFEELGFDASDLQVSLIVM